MVDPRQLLEAVNALYSHPDEKVKKQANAWLEQWQQSLEAWSISDKVLHDPASLMDAQYFCAQTLRTKVQRDFEELPADAIGSLRDSLMELLLRYAADAPMVRVQLCLALAAMVAHVPSAQWGQGGVLQWLLTRLEGVSPEIALPVMLEMLVVLPEEANSYSPSVRPERRRQMQDEMVSSGPMALQVLASCLNQPGSQTRARVLEAFVSWLVLTPGAGLPGSQLAQHPLVTAALEGLNSPETFDEAVEALVELIYSTSSKGTPDQESAALVSRLVPAVIGLVPKFVAASKVAQAEKQNPGADIPGADTVDDEDTIKGMARLFAEVGEAFTAMIASGSPDALKPVEALLEVAGHPDNEICAMSFNFWHRLSRQLNSGFSAASTSDRQEAERMTQQRRESFFPAFTQLVALIRGRVRYPDNFDTLHEDEKRDFRSSRYAIADTLLDAAGVLGADRILQLLVEPLQSLGQTGNNFDWRTAEAALYCIKSVHKVVTTPGHPTLVVLFQGLLQLPTVPRLQHTAALTLGAYSDWLAATLQQGGLTDLMPQLLQMLTTALSNEESASAAAMAFRDICESCGAQLGAYLEALMRLYHGIQGSGALATGATSSGGMALDEEDVLQIMEAVALIVTMQPEAQRRAALNAMLVPVIQLLQEALQLQARQPNGNGVANGHSLVTEKVLPLFDRLTVILRYVKDAGAVTDALIQVWPVLETALQQNLQSATAVERLCRAPRYALRTAGKLAGTGSLVVTMMAAIPQWFSACPHSSFLYLASELVKIFGDVPRQEGALAELLGQLLERASQRLQTLKQFDDDPDVADDTFLLASRVLSYSPKLLVTNSRLVSTLLDSAQAGILVQHREACESVLTFIARLFEEDTLMRCSKEAGEQLHAILAPKAPTIFRLLLAGATGALPSSRVMQLSETLAKLLKATKRQGIEWMGQAVNLLPEEAATAEDRSRLMTAAMQVASASDAKASIGLMDAAMHELSELIRRNRRSQEAAQLKLLPAELRQTLW